MDFSNIASRFVKVDQFSYPISAEPYTVLYDIPVAAGLCDSSYNNGDLWLPSYPAFLASTSVYWRGSLRYRFSFVKNRFYSGRIAIAFLSGLLPTATITTADLEAAPRVVVDLRENSEYIVEVPFTSHIPYLRTKMFTGMNQSEITDTTQTLGQLIVYVVNSLVGNASIPPSIQCNVWFAGCKDFEIAVPQMSAYTINPTITTPAVFSREAQSEHPDVHTGLSDYVFFCKENSLLADSTNAAASCMGEKITNLRPLTRRFTYSSGFPNCNLNVDPHYFGGPTAFEYVSWLYKFWRGSRRYKLHPYSTEAAFPSSHFVVGFLDFTLNSAAPSAPTASSLTTASSNTFQHLTQSDMAKFNQVTVPYYHSMPYQPLTSVSYFNNVRNNLKFTSSSTNVACNLYMAVGDDFSFHYLNGAPCLNSV